MLQPRRAAEVVEADDVWQAVATGAPPTPSARASGALSAREDRRLTVQRSADAEAMLLLSPFWEADHYLGGAPRPMLMTTGWRVYQIRVGRARAWPFPPSKGQPAPGPSLSCFKNGEVIGTVLDVKHTFRFTSARVLLQDRVEDSITWINIWTNVNKHDQPRGVLFCAVCPPFGTPDLENDGEVPDPLKVASPCAGPAPRDDPWGTLETPPSDIGRRSRYEESDGAAEACRA